MASGRIRGVGAQAVVRELRHQALTGATLPDGELLQRYLATRDDAAFAALVRRHGPMVLGVCRRIAGDAHDADDAFQATFLILVRRAGCIKPRERVGAWLYGVAYRTALKAKAMSQRRRSKQQPLADVPAPALPADGEWLALLDREIQRLPDKYRLPIVLCDLEGKTRKQAAATLGWPEGTVATRLRDGRALVQKRLARHGLAVTGAAATFAWGQALSAITVPSTLTNTTIQVASVFASGKAAGLIPVHILALVKGVLQAMMFTKLKNATALVLLLAVLGIGLHRVTGQDGPGGPTTTPPAPMERRQALHDAPPPTKYYDAEVSPKLEANNSKLPTGPAPVQALVSLDKDHVVVRTNQTAYIPRQSVDEAGQVRSNYFELQSLLVPERHDKRRVEVYDTKRRKLNDRDVALRLKEEIPALVVYGTRDIDPLHLRLLKEDTLIVTLPAPTTPRPWAPIPKTATEPPAVPVPLPSVPAVPAGAALEPLPQVIERNRTWPPPAIRRDATIPEAERDMDIAAFYLKSDKRLAAAFYYELVCKRWPGTMYAERAATVLQELRRLDKASTAPGAQPRIGQIIITGNNKVPDSHIRGALRLYPGQVASYDEIRKAVESISLDFKTERGVIKVVAKITVRARSDSSDSQYNDLLVDVHETPAWGADCDDASVGPAPGRKGD